MHAMNSNASLATSQVELSGDTDVIVTRSFAAPPKLVFAALTKPALIRRWLLGPDGWTMPVCEVDLRPGGAYRYRWRNDAGTQEFGFTGIFREIAAPRRIVHTERDDDGKMPGEILVTTELSKGDRGTIMRITMSFDSKETRDAALGTGMTDGMEASYARLEKEVLPGLVA